jgi:1-acyl-sn-glycerol-3-phosphate acyltransferase
VSVVLNEGSGTVAPGRDPARPISARELRPTRSGVADRLWRSLAQVALFGAFGAGGALMTALIRPGLAVFVRDPQVRHTIARRCLQRGLRAYTGAMQALRLVDLEIDGGEHLGHRGVLIVANHPTLIDAFFLLGHVDHLVPIAKRVLLVNPFTSGAIRAANYLVNDHGPALVEACRERLAAGESLLLFPEGGRTAADGQIQLRRGAAQLSVRSGCRVVPVTIAVSERFLTRGRPWWLAAATRPRVRIVAFAPVDPAPFVAAGANAALAARRMNACLQQFYSKESVSRGSV